VTNLVSLWRKLSAVALLSAVLLPYSSSAQNIADNIRPVGSVCMIGQACVGTTAGKSGGVAMPARAAADAMEEAVEEAIDVTAEATTVAAADSDFDPAGVYQTNCFACHGTGAAGAPMLGDSEAWGARMEKGMEAVMANAINGIGAMPARGICMSCSDEDLQLVVEYMLAQ